MYDFPITIIACFLIFKSILNKYQENRILDKLLDKSIGIWVMHPFVLMILNKLYFHFFGEASLVICIFFVLVSVMVCSIVVEITAKNKYLKKLFVV